MPGQGVDLQNRDPVEINSHVKCEFEEVLGEPDGAHAMDCVWTNTYKCFNCTKDLCYMIATLLCGICLAFYWGWTYACVAFYHVWCLTPSLKVCQIDCHYHRRCLKLFTDSCCGPVCETMGLCLSQITMIRK